MPSVIPYVPSAVVTTSYYIIFLADNLLIDRALYSTYCFYVYINLSNLIRLFSTFWDYALAIKLRQIVYLHCHKNRTPPLTSSSAQVCQTKCFSLNARNRCSLDASIDEGENMILVALDGVQHPAFRFPRGGHLLAFLSCLESGLLAIGGALEPTLFASDTDSHSGALPLFRSSHSQSLRYMLAYQYQYEYQFTGTVVQSFCNYSPVSAHYTSHIELSGAGGAEASRAQRLRVERRCVDGLVVACERRGRAPRRLPLQNHPPAGRLH